MLIRALKKIRLPKKERVWLLVTAIALTATLLSAFEVFAHPEGIREFIAGSGHAGPALFIAIFSMTTALGAPRMLMYPISGLLFGFLSGLLWSMLATLSGAYLAFVYARWAGSEWVIQKWPKAAEAARHLHGRSALKVAIIRQLPMPGFISNLIFGISRVSHLDFIIGSSIGFLPVAIPANLIGSSITADSNTLRTASILLAVALILLLWAASPYLMKPKETAQLLDSMTEPLD